MSKKPCCAICNSEDQPCMHVIVVAERDRFRELLIEAKAEVASLKAEVRQFKDMVKGYQFTLKVEQDKVKELEYILKGLPAL